MKHIKMPKALAEKWLEDLRSGEYQQCRAKMTDGSGYCCLGVLQMGISGEIIMERADEVPSKEWLHSKNIEFFDEFDEKENYPYSSNKEASFLDLNDLGTPFPEIADLLEIEIEYNDD